MRQQRQQKRATSIGRTTTAAILDDTQTNYDSTDSKWRLKKKEKQAKYFVGFVVEERKMISG